MYVQLIAISNMLPPSEVWYKMHFRYHVLDAWLRKKSKKPTGIPWTGCSTASDGSGGVPWRLNLPWFMVKLAGQRMTCWLGDLCPGGFQGTKHIKAQWTHHMLFIPQRKKSLAVATPRKAYTQMTGVCRLVKALWQGLCGLLFCSRFRLNIGQMVVTLW